MTQFVTLLKVLFKSRYRRDRGVVGKARYRSLMEQKTGGKFDPMWIVYGLLGLIAVPVVAGICWLVAVYTPVFAANGLLPYMLLMIYITVMLAVLVFGLIGMLTYVYINRDAEFLAGLPIKGWKLFLAKLCMVYLGELALAAGIIVPVGITMGIAGGFGFAFYVSILLSVLFVPALPLLLASLLAIPLMYCVSFFKNKGALTSIVVLLLVGTVFTAYYTVYFKFIAFQQGGTGDADIEAAVAGLISGLQSVKYVLYPVFALIEFGMALPTFGMTGAGAQLLALGIALAAMAAVVGITSFIANLVYSKSAAAQLENSSKRAKRAMAYESSGGVMKALIKKEWRTLIRETAFAFQCLFGLVVGPVLVVILSLNFKSSFSGAAETAGELTGAALDPALVQTLLSGIIMAIILMIVSGMNITASTAISREGKNFYQMKTMPVPYKTQVQAKLWLSLMISMPGSVIAFVIGAFLIPIPPLEAVLEGLFLCVYSYAFACFALRMDLMKPKLNWTTPTQAVKSNRSSTAPLLLNMLTGMVLAASFIVLGIFVSVLLAIGVLLVLVIAAAPLLHRYLFKSADRLFEEIEP
ncbi:hypothetical protein FACS1894211_13970 [Clostridia bacterium]|nr:hypothetical protein FACS1894211_13970 [Clostridia bacterium]